jgi:hypothetical protein
MGLFLIFILELCFIWNINEVLVDKISNFNNINYGEKQRKVFNVINSIEEGNKKNFKNAYILGGSSSREFFADEKTLNNIISLNNYNKIIMATISSQTLIDSLRLIEKINTKGSLVIIGLSPKKVFSEGSDTLIKSYINFGKYLKYPTNSDVLENIYPIYKIDNKLAFVPSSFRLSINLLKDFILEQASNIKSNGLSSFKFTNNEVPIHHYKKYVKRLSEENLLNLEKKYFDTYLQSNINILENIEYNEKLLRIIIALCKEKKLKLVLFNIPINHLVPILYSKYYFKYNELVKGLNTNIINFNDFANDSSFFHDTSHLNKYGKRHFRNYMIKGLNNALSF